MMSVTGQAPLPMWCELAGCGNRATVTISACGIFHICDGCHVLIVALGGEDR